MKLTLIITTYNWPESLLLVIESVRLQSAPPDEIIIADDGSNDKTKELISKLNNVYGMDIIHSWQEDIGFRAARSRNKAILQSTGDYIVLVDGDTILHSDFIKDHKISAEPGFFVQGSRALISEYETKKALAEKNVIFSFFSSELKNRKNAIYSRLLSLIFSNKTTYLDGIKSCNLAFFKNDCFEINGFNNDFEGWGREDSEFIVRMINNGIIRKNIRFKAIQYHLWHNENSRQSLDRNNKILDNAITYKKNWCDNGINSLVENEN